LDGNGIFWEMYGLMDELYDVHLYDSSMPGTDIDILPFVKADTETPMPTSEENRLLAVEHLLDRCGRVLRQR